LSETPPAPPCHWTQKEDYYTQAGNLFRLMDAAAQKRLIDNIVGAMRTVPVELQKRQIAHFHKADPAYGEGAAKGPKTSMTDVAKSVA